MDEQRKGKPAAPPVEQDLYGLSFRLYESDIVTNYTII